MNIKTKQKRNSTALVMELKILIYQEIMVPLSSYYGDGVCLLFFGLFCYVLCFVFDLVFFVGEGEGRGDYCCIFVFTLK
jgi:hypothetical protein